MAAKKHSPAPRLRGDEALAPAAGEFAPHAEAHHVAARARVEEPTVYRDSWRSKFCFAAAGAVATGGITGIVALVTLNYAGWTDIADDLLRGLHVHVLPAERVPFWESVVYIGILAAVVVFIVREILRAIDHRT